MPIEPVAGASARPPILATYRVQLHAGLGFDQAASLAGYLADLGVSHLYASPCLESAPGSPHGYDVVDPTRVSAERGGSAAHARMCEAMAAHGLGQVLDIVPNHMAIVGRANPWWWDVLENGPASRFAARFDVDWEAPEARLRNLLLLPVLGDHYGRVLEAGQLEVEREAASFTIRYFEHEFPVAPRSLGPLLGRAAARSGSAQLGFLADAFAELPLPTATDEASLARRHRDREVLAELLLRLLQDDAAAAAAVDAEIAALNASPDDLDAFLEGQNHRLAHWRSAERDLGYRRFFDVNTLVGLHVEDERVFRDSHALPLEWFRRGFLDGFRVDHPDGMRDPEGYLRRLADAAPDAWIVVEKILEADEPLPPNWPVAGTTGYEFLNRVGGLFVDPEGEEGFTDLYRRFTQDGADFRDVVRDKKRLVLRDLLGSDVNRLAALLLEICERQRRYRDYTRHELSEALRELIACFPVYRTYVRTDPPHVSARDLHYVAVAVRRAVAQRPDVDPALFEFIGDLLLLRVRGRPESELALRFQQLTGPAMAKGVEDTALYAFTRLVALNEVGGDPTRFGVAVGDFHGACAETQRLWPRTMLATSTHDTKRSEDVRARLAVLSEMPGEWDDAVTAWARQNERHWEGRAPDRGLEYLLYQTLVGAWPIEAERVQAYALKAAREAKERTSWTRPDAAYEEGLQAFVAGLMASAPFVASLEAFVARVEWPGRVNSMAQTLLKMTAPGVPDVYQGCELWELSLVDPDNRRPVDFARRHRLLRELPALAPETILARADEGLPKLHVIHEALSLRRRRPEAFGPAGDYAPLEGRGARARHVVAFTRGGAVAAIVPRLVVALDGDWKDTTVDLPRGVWRNVLTGDAVAARHPTELRALLSRFPVALLDRVDAA